MNASQPLHTPIRGSYLSILFLVLISLSSSLLYVADIPPLASPYWMGGSFLPNGSIALIQSLFAQNSVLQQSEPPVTPLDKLTKRRFKQALSNQFLDDQGARQFAEQLYSGQTGVIQGVYVSQGFSFPVIQQPEGKDLYVSNKSGLVTQFKLAADNGVTGLLAHNYLSGKEFYNLEVGQVIWMIYGNKEIKPYKVSLVQHYQKLDPSNSHSDFLDLSNQRKLTASELFGLYYRGEHHVTFQTCLEAENSMNWGLLFVIATPLDPVRAAK